MPARKNYEIGSVIGIHKILALDEEKTLKMRRAYWKCECIKCGKITSTRQDNLIQGCKACIDKEKEHKGIILDNLIGKTFGEWTVIGKANKTNYWICRCSCGNIKEVFRGNLTQGTSKSCGHIFSWGEHSLIFLLQQANIDFKTQVTFSDLRTNKNGTPRFDFAIYEDNQLKCLIEYDGRQHQYYDKNWKMNKEDFNRLLYIDNLKTEYCKQKSITLYRLNKDTNLEKFIKNINKN